MVAQSSGTASEDGATEACKLTVDDTVDDSEIRRENQLRLESVYLPLFTTGFIDVGWLALGFLNHQPYDDVFSRSESLLSFFVGGKGFMLV